MAKQSTPFPLRIKPATHSKLKEVAERRGMNMTSFLNFIIKTHLLEFEGWSDQVQEEVDRLKGRIKELENG